MKVQARKTWDEMKDDPPGQRFQRHHRRRREQGDREGRVLHFLLVIGLVLVGVVLLFIPGPAVVLFALAGALLSEDSLHVAKALDWLEVWIRRLVTWGSRVWKRAGTAARAGIVLLGLVVAGAGAYGAWWIAFGR
jgi:hypothetical protein